MKVIARRTKQSDLENIYELHRKCFTQNDQWYKSAISNYLDNGILIEIVETKKIIGILLQGTIIPCNQQILNADYEPDIFYPITETGKNMMNNNIHLSEVYGIVMICVDPNFRSKGIGKKLIQKHFQDNKNKKVYLNTRKSNVNAYFLYKSMGYEHIAYIKNKYFLPNEDAIFMIKYIN